MSEPAEICPDHDLIIDQYGCWACGHGGPLTDEVWPSWYRWAMDGERRMSAALSHLSRHRLNRY